MKTKLRYLFMVLSLTVSIILSSCSDFMDYNPATEYAESDVFNDAGLTQALINTIYNYVRDGAREHNTTGLTDDAYFTHNYGQIAVNEANVSGSDIQWYNDWNNPFHWKNSYQGIYYANLVLENIDKVPPLAGYDIAYMKGEVLFLRAWLYSRLVQGFGGVPIIDKTYGLNDAVNISIPRSNVEDCLKFIIADLDTAIPLLYDKVSDANLGRATKWAAIALKARMYLQIASPLYADRSVNTLDVNQFKGDRKVLYRNALDAAKEVIKSGRYELIDCNAPTIAEIADKYHQIAISNNKEMIFTKQFNSKDVTNQLPIQHGPNGYHNWSGTTPTQDFVMHFEMEDGSLSDALTQVGQHQVGNPYNGREPRFYANVGYDGAVWGRVRPADAYPLDPTPLGNLQCGTYELTDGSNVTVNLPDGSKVEFKGIYGIDTRQGPIEDWNGSWTSYYEKKLIDTSVDGQNFPQVVPWPYIRLAEMYLIAAEAAIELEELDDAIDDYLDPLRQRIGRPDTRTTLAVRGKAVNQENLREFLRHERRSELSFEDFRYFDVRRWMIAPQTGNKTLTGMTIFARLKPGKTAMRPYIHDESIWDYHYYVKDLSFRENRKWDNKMYFAPITRDEIKRNAGLVQNPGMD